MTTALKNIIYNCKHATLLIEKRIFGKITVSETVQLQIHLAGCSVCKTFQHQSLLINRLFTNFRADDLKLEESFKISLQQRIEIEINKN